MSFVQRIQDLFSTQEPTEQPQATSEPTVQLFRCEDCSTTYIAETLDECPECDSGVETTPSERELGLI
jgi:ABC-type ATPase with predicted acetyltransferase domain